MIRFTCDEVPGWNVDDCCRWCHDNPQDVDLLLYEERTNSLHLYRVCCPLALRIRELLPVVPSVLQLDGQPLEAPSPISLAFH